MTIKPGTLVYDKESGRYDIRSGLNEYYGEHWKPTRIEMDMRRNWYLVGIKSSPSSLVKDSSTIMVPCSKSISFTCNASNSPILIPV